MQPAMDATLTAVGTSLYAPAIENSVGYDSAADLRLAQHSDLELLASRKEYIDRYVLVPILESDDIFAAFSDKRTEYKDWRNAWVSALADEARAQNIDIESVLAMQDAQDDHLKKIFTGSHERLGEPAVRALVGAVSLKKIVRNATMPYSEGWPEESWRYIAHLFASSELCMIGVLHHLATGIGRNENVQTLADWSFIYTDDAYSEAGYYGPDAASLEGKK